MADRALARFTSYSRFPVHGWMGVLLIGVFWPLNWLLDGLRTHWGFFPLWAGYCLMVDGLNVYRRGTSLLARDRGMYLGLFVISAPIWWVFEAVNLRTQNWYYLGREFFTNLEYALLATLSFSTVVPAVLGTAELVAGFDFIQRFRKGVALRPSRRTNLVFLIIGLVMFALMMTWPRIFFPFIWLFVYFLLEPINVWAGNRSLFEWIRQGDWRPVGALCVGVLVCGFFWEMWNFYSFPKWEYDVPLFGFWHIFEMPFFGYFGYLPFALEIFAMFHLVTGLFGKSATDYVTVGLAQER